MRFAVPILCLMASPALAGLKADFIEGAPKDKFVITNQAACAIGAARIEIDFEGSAGALVFDTEDSGAGVEVFQPLEFVSNSDVLASIPDLRDGDRVLSMDILGLAPGQSLAFTVDVDDTLGAREITVNGQEIAGAVLRFGETEAIFDHSATALVAEVGCAT